MADVINLILLIVLSSFVLAQNIDNASKRPDSKKTPSKITKLLVRLKNYRKVADKIGTRLFLGV